MKIEGIEILRSGEQRITRAKLEMNKSRNAIKPGIERIIMGGQLDRNPVKVVLGDTLHPVLCDAGHNMRQLLRKLGLLCAKLRVEFQEILRSISMKQQCINVSIGQILNYSGRTRFVEPICPSLACNATCRKAIACLGSRHYVVSFKRMGLFLSEIGGVFDFKLRHNFTISDN